MYVNVVHDTIDMGLSMALRLGAGGRHLGVFCCNLPETRSFEAPWRQVLK